MPQLPQYRQQVSATKNVSTAQSTTDLTTVKQMQELSRRIAEVGEKVKKVDQFRQKTDADIKLSTQLNDLQIQHSEDTDLSEENRQQYYDKVDTLMQEALEGIKDPIARLEYESRAAGMSLQTKRSMQSVDRNLVLQAAKDNLELQRITALETASNLDLEDSAGVMRARAGYQIALDEAVEKGLLLPNAREAALIKYSQEVALRRTARAIYEDPEQALSDLENNTYGLDEVTRAEKIKDASVYKARLEQAVRTEKMYQGNKIYNDTITAIFNGENINIHDVENNPLLSPSQKSQIKKVRQNLPNRKAINNIKVASLLDMQDEIFNGNGGVRGINTESRLTAAGQWFDKAVELYVEGAITDHKFQKLTKGVLTGVEDWSKYSKYAKAWGMAKEIAMSTDPINWAETAVDLREQFVKDIDSTGDIQAETITAAANRQEAKKNMWKDVKKTEEEKPVVTKTITRAQLRGESE